MPLAYNQFYVDTVTPRLYFPIAEAGKSILIRDLYYNDGAGNSQHVSNETYRLNDNRSQFVSFTVNGVAIPYTFIDLRTNHPDAVTWDSSPTGFAASGVQGISLRTRVIWSNGSTISRDVSGNNQVRTRYRKVDMNTILTRTTGQ